MMFICKYIGFCWYKIVIHIVIFDTLGTIVILQHHCARVHHFSLAKYSDISTQMHFYLASGLGFP